MDLSLDDCLRMTEENVIIMGRQIRDFGRRSSSSSHEHDGSSLEASAPTSQSLKLKNRVGHLCYCVSSDRR